MNANHNKLVLIKTENTYEFKVLLDVLKEILSEVTITVQAEQFIENSKSTENGEGANVENTTTDDTKTEQKKDVVKKKGGLKIVAVDDQQTIMIYVRLNSDSFSEYFVKYKSYDISLDLRELHKFMKGVDKDYIMTMSIDKDEQQKIEFHLQNQFKLSDKFYRQKLLDTGNPGKKIPDTTEFEIAVEMKTQEFKKVCSDMSQYSENIEIICTSKEIVFKCVGDQSELTIKSQNTLNQSKDSQSRDNDKSGVKIMLSKNVKKNIVVQGIYSLKQLAIFGRCVNLCEDLQLFLKNTYPLFVCYQVGSLGRMLVGFIPIDEKFVK